MTSLPPSLPLSPEFVDDDEYVNSLLDFVAGSSLLRLLCGGVHILDFFTEPSLYSQIFPESWRVYFESQDIMDLLELFMRTDLARFEGASTHTPKDQEPPPDLIRFLRDVRKHLLGREPKDNQCSRNRAMKPTQKLARHVAVGMTIKKIHEVGLFAHYVHNLTESIAQTSGQEVSHLVDFGSGQNYLGRALASEPYNHRIVAIESKSHNAERAKEFDVMARLAAKPAIMRNKKAFRAGVDTPDSTDPGPTSLSDSADPSPTKEDTSIARVSSDGSIHIPVAGHGRIQYIEHRLQNGELSSVISQISQSEELPSEQLRKSLMVISLHSCGNLVHHGLRSLILNPAVRAVAMIGCCYNLVTERLGPATYKLPELRPTTHAHPRLHKLGEACDPNGFPMSARLCNAYNDSVGEKGVRLNITSRMMAVQAPQNWGRKDSEAFFTRHFYRALLQRVFLDKGIVSPPTRDCVGGHMSPRGHTSGGTPIIIGSLRKGCYESFVKYARGALEKLTAQEDTERANIFKEKLSGTTDEEFDQYELNYSRRKKELSICWSLMAFCAGVIEATIVIDRWLWLKEQKEVENAWVEPVFDYAISPRNLVIVGIKKSRAD